IRSRSDAKRVHRPDSTVTCVRQSPRAPSSQAKVWLGGALVLGARLPLLAGAATTYATGKDEGIEALLAPTSDFSKLEQGEAMPGGGATSRGSTDTSNAFSLSS